MVEETGHRGSGQAGVGVSIKGNYFSDTLLEHSGAGFIQDLAEGAEAMTTGSWIQL